MQFLKGSVLGALLLCSACSTTTQPVEDVKQKQEVIKEEIIVVEPVKQEPVLTLAQQIKKTHKLGIIGEVEPVYFPPMKAPMLARIDTGAEFSAIGAENIKTFEREGAKWVSFDITNRQTKEKVHFEKRIYRMFNIKRQMLTEDRIGVLMTVQMGKEKITTSFSLADRSKFDYQILIGRNVLTGRAIVDTARAKTLY